jgi:aminopeptidase N
MRTVLFFLLSLISSANAFANSGANSGYFRDLERQTKSQQAKVFRQAISATDFAPAPEFDVEAYDFDVKLDPVTARLSGLVVVSLVATTDEISEVALDATALDVGAVFFIDRSGVRSRVRSQYSVNGLRVSLPAKLKSGDHFSLAVVYSVRGDRRDGKATDVQRGLFFVGADPERSGATSTIYTSSEPQLARTWFPCVDSPEFKAARSRMRVTVPEGWTAVSNGTLKSETPNPQEKTVTFDWEEHFPISTYLISIAAAPYVRIEDKWRSIPVEYFVPRELETKARYDFGRTPEMIEHFSKLWGDYPYEKYAMAAVPFFSGAMENTTATSISDWHISGDRETEDTVAHELAHHWWGDLVTPSSWDDLWLNEGFATYAEVEFARAFKGEDAALDYLLWNRTSYLKSDPKAKASVVDSKVAPDEKFSPTVYEKGSWVVHMLRNLVGEKSFSEALSLYLKTHAFKNASTADLQKAFETVSGKSLQVFFDQWVYGPGYPVLSAKWSYDQSARRVEIGIDQWVGEGRSVFYTPVEVLIAGIDSSGKTVTLRTAFSLTEASQVFSQVLPSNFPSPTGVVLDPDLKLLKDLKMNRSLDEIKFWLAQSNAEFPRAWLARLDAISTIPDQNFSAELLRSVVARFEAEPSTPVRARMLDVIAEARDAKDISSDDIKQVRALIRDALSDRETDVRQSAASASKYFLDAELTALLIERFEQEKSDPVRAELAQSLVETGSPQTFDLLYGELQHSRLLASHRKLLKAVLTALGKLGDRRAAAILTDFASGGDPFLMTAALESLGSLALPETFEFIKDILVGEKYSAAMRTSAANALANFGGPASAKALSDQFSIEKNDEVRSAIGDALKRLGGEPAKFFLKGWPAILQW